MSFTLKTLTEGIRDRHVGQQNKRLVEKWSRTGLLRGMEETNRENMATLLENQAAQVLRESSTMGSDAVGGFTNIAFPIVRRVFGGLVANELVSIQPMSLPSGLLFYLDYTYGNEVPGYAKGSSIYGQPSGKDIQSGASAVGGQYDLAGSGFSRRHVKASADGDTLTLPAAARTAKGDLAANELFCLTRDRGAPNSDSSDALTSDASLKVSNQRDLKLIQFDPQIIERIEAGEHYAALLVHPAKGDLDGLVTFDLSADVSMVKDFALVAPSEACLLYTSPSPRD